MIADYTIQQKLLKLDSISGHEEKMYEMLKMYIDTFPVLDAQLFQYSVLSHVGEGIIAVDDAGIRFIKDIRDDTRTLPVIYDVIQKRRATYQTGMDYFKSTKSHYIIPSHHNSLLVVPIFVKSYVLGYICTSEFEDNFKPTEKTLHAITYFGELIGKIFTDIQTIDNHKDNVLSRRELEVMKKVAMGHMTKEIATSIGIRDSTVKQYVKTAIKKLEAKNRTHAVTILFQKGIIS